MEVSFEQRLAALVKSLPILYDKNLPDFKDRNKRQHAWTEVALKLGLPSGKQIVIQIIKRYKAFNNRPQLSYNYVSGF